MRASMVRHIYDLYLSGGVGITQFKDPVTPEGPASPEHDISGVPRGEPNERGDVR